MNRRTFLATLAAAVVAPAVVPAVAPPVVDCIGLPVPDPAWAWEPLHESVWYFENGTIYSWPRKRGVITSISDPYEQ